MEEFRVGSVTGTLGLALYVLACMFSILFCYESTIRFVILIGFQMASDLCLRSPLSE
jgi:hypothetical protein